MTQLKSSTQTALDTKLNNTSDTMTGDLTVTGNSFSDTLQYTRSFRLPDGIDLDTVDGITYPSGFYDIDATNSANTPYADWIYLEVQRHHNTNGFCKQIVTVLGNDSATQWIRIQAVGSWTPWYKIWNENTNGGKLTSTQIDFVSEYDNGIVSANTEIDWDNGNDQVITLAANITLTFSNMGIGHKQLRIIMDSTGGRTATLPTGLWPGGISGILDTSANAINILSIFYNGTNYYYQLTKGWA